MSRQRLRSLKKRKRWVARSESRSDHPGRVFDAETYSPILQLQHTLGNQCVAQLIQAKRLTPEGKIIGFPRKATVGATHDRYEQEADLRGKPSGEHTGCGKFSLSQHGPIPSESPN